MFDKTPEERIAELKKDLKGLASDYAHILKFVESVGMVGQYDKYRGDTDNNA